MKWTILILTVATVFALAWIHGLRWLYRVKGKRPQRLQAQGQDGWKLAVYFRPATYRRYQEPILLCHGLASNHYNLDFIPPYSLAHFLSDAGYDCYTVEWRGTGASRAPPPGKKPWDYTIDDQINFDAPALLQLALLNSQASSAFWLGHSLGGLIGYAAAQTSSVTQIKGLISLGAPLFFIDDRLLNRAIRLLALAAWPHQFRQRLSSIGLAPFLGRIPLPFSDVMINPLHVPAVLQRQLYPTLMESIGRKVLLQFRDWVVHDVFRSYDLKIDYRAGLGKIPLPLLVIGGSSDRLASPAAVRAGYALAETSDKTLFIFGKDRGDQQNYGHGDLLFGTGAPSEVYPVITDWLNARASTWHPPPTPNPAIF